MKSLMVGEFRRNFSKVLDIVKQGEEIIIRTGRKKENIAVLVPFEKYTGNRQRKLGILENKASFNIKDDFKITAEELLNL
jgi:prevent-host-death family protein